MTKAILFPIMFCSTILCFDMNISKAQKKKCVISGQFVFFNEENKLVGLPEVLIRTETTWMINGTKPPKTALMKGKPEILTVQGNAFDRKWYVRWKGDNFLVKNKSPFIEVVTFSYRDVYLESFILKKNGIGGFQLDFVTQFNNGMMIIDGSPDLSTFVVLNPLERFAISDKAGKFKIEGNFPEHCILHCMHQEKWLEYEQHKLFRPDGSDISIDLKKKHKIDLGKIIVK